ncbi:hypothetical protein [Aliikangiella coralliicola]|uniref:Uncharacterized protein n=1 Tax=Aliikangiella coralliicola TaxID=2592383 RepID=A0A545UJL1_9GAMM|nr:hypothetical protein [Aliikangiella coralliicola]TQV89652.1 hypothetical protein FLL46_01855 [Aliikangiella coralliicola]
MIKFLSIVLITLFSAASTAEESLLRHAQSVYKLDDSKLTDFLIEVVNMDVLEGNKTKFVGEVILSLAPVEREEFFDCKRFYNEIGETRAKAVNEKMTHYLFACKDPHYTERDALEKLSKVLKTDITHPYEVDATWAWFSATGNTGALKRFLENYLKNENTCHRCIEWSYASNYKQNQDVYLYLKEYSTTVGVEDKLKLFRLAPNVEDEGT